MPVRILILSCFLVLCACVANPKSVAPLVIQNNGFMADESERKLISQSNALHEEILKQGLIVNDSAISNYLSDIAKRFTPILSNGPTLNYYVVKDSSINAMALPNGNIYIHAGLIERLESEDQLALVMAHETAHVVQRHSYKGKLDRHNTVVAAHITDLLLGGTGLAYLPFAANLASFSREQEEEADLEGISYLNGKGYDLLNGIEIFDKLREVKHRERADSIWASHPDLIARKNYSTKQIATLSDTVTTENRNPVKFESIRSRMADVTIQLRVLSGQYELARDAIDFEVTKQGNNAKWHVLRGDTWRETAEHPDAAAREYAWLYKKNINAAITAKFENSKEQAIEKAITEYEAALNMDKQSALAYRGIGLAYCAQKNPIKAREHLQRYLTMSERPYDRRYIESVLSRLEQP